MIRGATTIGLALVAAVAGATVAAATVLVTNETTANVTLTAGPTWYQYGTGKRLAFQGQTGDTFTATEVDTATGDVILDTAIPTAAPPAVSGNAWWDTDWKARTCATISQQPGDSTVEYVDVQFDSTAPNPWAANGWIQPDYGDLRAVVNHDGTLTEAPFWLATPHDTNDGHVFVKIDFAAATTQMVCLYFYHQTGGLTSTSDPELGQHFPRQGIYRRLETVHSKNVSISNPTSRPVNYSVTPSGPTQTLAPNQIVRATVESVLYADGALNVRDVNNISDSYAPMFHLGTTFVTGTNRGINQFCITPTLGAIVTIDHPDAIIATIFAPTAIAPCVTSETSQHSLITATAPVNITHYQNSKADMFSLYPATTKPLYGVPSQNLIIGTTGPGNVELFYSDATTPSVEAMSATGYSASSTNQNGQPPAVRVRPLGGQSISANQQADGDGTESTSFLPVEALAARYVLPRAVEYVGIACVKPNDKILIDGTPISCSTENNAVGHARMTDLRAGTTLVSESGAAFWVMAETQDQEANLFTPRFDWANRQIITELESQYRLTGTWTATRTANTDVWGLVKPDFAGTVTFATGCAPTNSFGPATASTSPQPSPADPSAGVIAHACDAQDSIDIRASLTSTDGLSTPRISRVEVEHSLTIQPEPTVEYPIDAPGDWWLWRIHGAGEYAALGTNLTAQSSTATGRYRWYLVDGTMAPVEQVTANDGALVTSNSASVPVHRSSVMTRVDIAPDSTTGAASDQIRWSASLEAVAVERMFAIR